MRIILNMPMYSSAPQAHEQLNRKPLSVTGEWVGGFTVDIQ